MALNMTLLDNNPISMNINNPAIGNLNDLHTTDKTSIVAAINEVEDTKVDGPGMAISVNNGVLTVTY